jgi:hypothetical protein
MALIQERWYSEGPIMGLNIPGLYAPVEQTDLKHVSLQGI